MKVVERHSEKQELLKKSKAIICHSLKAPANCSFQTCPSSLFLSRTDGGRRKNGQRSFGGARTPPAHTRLLSILKLDIPVHGDERTYARLHLSPWLTLHSTTPAVYIAHAHTSQPHRPLRATSFKFLGWLLGTKPKKLKRRVRLGNRFSPPQLSFCVCSEKLVGSSFPSFSPHSRIVFDWHRCSPDLSFPARPTPPPPLAQLRRCSSSAAAARSGGPLPDPATLCPVPTPSPPDPATLTPPPPVDRRATDGRRALLRPPGPAPPRRLGLLRPLWHLRPDAR